MTIEGAWNNATKSIELNGKSVDTITGKDLVVHQL